MVRVGGSPTLEGPGYATGSSGENNQKQNVCFIV